MKTFAYRRRPYLIAPIIIVAVAVFSFVIMMLWNALMPVIFELPVISYWQAAGLLILARLFFGGARPHHGWGGHRWPYGLKEKMAKMSPEEKEKFFQKLHRYRYHFMEEHCKEKEEQ